MLHKYYIKYATYILFTLSLSAYSEVIVFDNVNVITMADKDVLYNQRVIVNNDVIQAIEESKKPLSIKADQIIDCKGKYMLPGFSDAHFHMLGRNPIDHEIQYKLAIANGITSVRNMAERKGQDVIEIRNRINSQDYLAPYFYTVGKSLESRDLKTVDDAIKVVKYHKERGYDFIKIHSNIPLEVYFTLLRESEKANIPLIGHAQRNLPLEYSLRLKSLAHVEDLVMILSDEDNLQVVDLTEDLANDVARRVKESGIYISPTLSIVAMIEDYSDRDRFKKLKDRAETAYLSVDEYTKNTKPGEGYLSPMFMNPKIKGLVRKVIEMNQKMTLALHKAGAQLLVGSDNIGFQITGFSIHDEMEAMNEAGVPPYEVLKAATINGARYLNRQGIAGTISQGKNAEFVLLAENPLSNIKNTRKIEGVMLKGKWLNRDRIDNLLDEAKRRGFAYTSIKN